MTGLTPEEERIAEIVAGVVQETLERMGSQGPKTEPLSDITRELAIMNERLSHLTPMIEAHERILRGNGKPGLVAVIERIEPKVEEHCKLLRGDGDGDGLVSRVSDLEESKSNMLKPIWLIGSVSLTAAVTWVIDLISHGAK